MFATFFLLRPALTMTVSSIPIVSLAHFKLLTMAFNKETLLHVVNVMVSKLCKLAIEGKLLNQYARAQLL